MTEKEKLEIKSKIIDLSRNHSDKYYNEFPEQNANELTKEQCKIIGDLDEELADKIIELFDKKNEKN